jgi:hypothetical protein
MHSNNQTGGCCESMGIRAGLFPNYSELFQESFQVEAPMDPATSAPRREGVAGRSFINPR